MSPVKFKDEKMRGMYHRQVVYEFSSEDEIVPEPGVLRVELEQAPILNKVPIQLVDRRGA